MVKNGSWSVNILKLVPIGICETFGLQILYYLSVEHYQESDQMPEVVSPFHHIA